MGFKIVKKWAEKEDWLDLRIHCPRQEKWSIPMGRWAGLGCTRKVSISWKTPSSYCPWEPTIETCSTFSAASLVQHALEYDTSTPAFDIRPGTVTSPLPSHSGQDRADIGVSISNCTNTRKICNKNDAKNSYRHCAYQQWFPKHDNVERNGRFSLKWAAASMFMNTEHKLFRISWMLSNVRLLCR